MRYGVIDLPSLPAMQLLETVSTETNITERMLRLKEVWTEHDPPAGAAYDVEGLEFDPLKIQAEMAAYFELLLRDRVNQATRGVTLAFGFQSDLDAIASRYPGGVPRLVDESDDRYRKRIWLSPNPLSPHGTAEAYQFWALTADPTLRDVSTVKIRPRLEDNPIILITCLLEGDEPRPSTAHLLEIRRYIQAESRQAMTDVISIAAPKIIETNYKVSLTLYPGPDKTTLVNAVQTNLLALIEKQRWLGQDHTRMQIAAACAIAGVHNAVVIEPAEDIFAAPDWFVRVNAVTVEYARRSE